MVRLVQSESHDKILKQIKDLSFELRFNLLYAFTTANYTNSSADFKY